MIEQDGTEEVKTCYKINLFRENSTKEWIKKLLDEYMD